ncbi:MAG: T9SS type A sorting domain-containing protein [Bacteroidales bacterium]|nr:T9SS type A sorting domain-containing protein [Bacteroidales bacterium]NPV35300.1 T9SS type A sorting domain-containing protein [Bacteroidales bacterium]
MRLRYLVLTCMGFSALIVSLSFSGEGGLKYPNGAPAGYTGSPGDGQNCTACHGGNATPASGVISTDIPPTGYVAGMTYNVTVSFSGSGKKGFELSPQKPTGEQVGTLIAGTGSKVLSQGKYITHSQASTSTTATWSFQWQAPAQPGSGPVTFYLAHVISKPNVFVSNLTVEENYHVGIPENSQTMNFEVYPNPASDYLFIKYNFVAETKVTLFLLPVSGSSSFVLFSGMLSQGENELKLALPEELTPGLYILKMQAGSYLNTSKILIK